jgi:hypothetical protein
MSIIVSRTLPGPAVSGPAVSGPAVSGPAVSGPVIATMSLFLVLAIPSMAEAECLCFTRSPGAELNRCESKGEFLLCVDSHGRKSATPVSQIGADWKRVTCDTACERRSESGDPAPVYRGNDPEKSDGDKTKPGQ